MSIDIRDFDKRAKKAVMAFWRSRDQARRKQQTSNRKDQGERSGVTAGKNMDGFVKLVCDTIADNGIDRENIHLKRKVVTLPGYFRPTKAWDLLVTHEQRLIAAIEFKSQVGPSFGNNFNNRAEEAIGTALDLATAFREGAFGDQLKPFVGWMMLLEDCPKSRRPVNDKSPHFPVFLEFDGASYADRYHILCRRMMQERLYDAAAFLLTPRTSARTGEFSHLDEMTSLRTFVAELAARVAAEIARTKTKP